MNINDTFGSKYLKAADIEEDVVVTIAGVQIEKVGQTDEKPVLYTNEFERGLVLNKTNSQTIAQLYGNETDDWTGKAISLTVMPVTFEGKTVDAIRVKARAPRAAQPQARPATAQAQRPGFNRPAPAQTTTDDNDVVF